MEQRERVMELYAELWCIEAKLHELYAADSVDAVAIKVLEDEDWRICCLIEDIDGNLGDMSY